MPNIDLVPDIVVYSYAYDHGLRKLTVKPQHGCPVIRIMSGPNVSRNTETLTVF